MFYILILISSALVFVFSAFIYKSLCDVMDQHARNSRDLDMVSVDSSRNRVQITPVCHLAACGAPRCGCASSFGWTSNSST